MVWEERWHPLRQEWVVISSHRDRRPWQGETSTTHAPLAQHTYRDCYLCPRNARVSGDAIPTTTASSRSTTTTRASARTRRRSTDSRGRILSQTAAPTGLVARRLLFAPDRPVARRAAAYGDRSRSLEELQRQFLDLASRPGSRHVLIFENKGEVVGVSNPHPHCQIYATNFVFRTIELEAEASSRRISRSTAALLFQDISRPKADGRRIIFENDSAIAFMPYFARYAYEVLSRKATHASLAALSPLSGGLC